MASVIHTSSKRYLSALFLYFCSSGKCNKRKNPNRKEEVCILQYPTRWKRQSTDLFIAIGLILAIVICSIPFRQEVEVAQSEEFTSSDQYRIEIGFGGPRVTHVRVMCNRTAEIRFMHQTGIWVSTSTVLLASVRSTIASYNFESRHSTNIVEIVSDGPIHAYIVYTYLTEANVNLFTRVISMFEQYP